jgi:hypothetical protein
VLYPQDVMGIHYGSKQAERHERERENGNDVFEHTVDDVIFAASTVFQQQILLLALVYAVINRAIRRRLYALPVILMSP